MKWTKIGLYASIGLTGILILGFLGETIGLFGGGDAGGYDANAKMYLLCANPACKAESEITVEDYSKMMQEMGPGGMMGPMMGPMAVNCPKCNKKSAYMAEKCEKCGVVFVPNYQSGDEYPDKCPGCGYSKYEEMSKQQQ
jgi:hypothetical protein